MNRATATSEGLRIAFVYDAMFPFVKGGAERRYHELATRLSQRNDVHYVTWTYWDGPAQVVRDGVTLHGLGTPPPLYGADGKRTVREAGSFAARLLPLLARKRWDVIDCSATPYLPLYAAWAATRLSRTPLVATWHEFWGDHWLAYLDRRPVVARIARSLEAGARDLGDATVAVSPFTARRMGQRNNADTSAWIVGNGVDLDAIRAARRAREEIDLVFVGRLIDEKRVDLLVDALALLRGRDPEPRSPRCTIVGDGPELARLRARVSALGLAETVQLPGSLPEARVFGLLKAAKLLVLPSIREGFGITVIEAQACGTVPLVARSPTSGAPDLVRDGIDGTTCDPTPTALADAIAALLASPDGLASMARAARTAARRYDWNALAEQMEGVYRAVAIDAEATSPRRRLGWS
ncbi:MAG: glycosyltransferase family 4 protein [Chloroflexota bacterium]|nr:glycosyltransferase family 4 protein [Chloroflexota bacterium]